MPTPSTDECTLTLERTLKAPREKVWRCWTEADLLMQWYCPKPWRVSQAELDVRSGGQNKVIMQGPNGEEMAVPGIYLEVEIGRRLVFTDAFERAWIPSGKAFMVAEITFSDTPEGHTHYLARARHWNAADCETHKKMGFHEGWGIAADQLEALAQTL